MTIDQFGLKFPKPRLSIDEKRNIIDVSITKKGGDFKFPWGGGVNIPMGWCARKASLMAKMIPPWERHLHAPPIKPNEKLVSEIYMYVTKHVPKKELTVNIHCYEENLKLFDLKMRFKKNGQEEWNDIDMVYNEKEKIATIQTDVFGTFAVVSIPKTERFTVPMQGVLHNAKINRYISIRFPRKALIEATTECEISIVPMDMRKVEIAKERYGSDFTEVNDFTLVSDFYDIQSANEPFKETRKPISVKLPILKEGSDLNDADEDTEEVEDPSAVDLETFAVMHKTAQGWELVESTYKFTRTTVTFDVKSLGRYCMVHHKPDRKPRLKLGMPHIEKQIEVIYGDILCFIYMEKKMWRLLFEVIDRDLTDLIVKERLQTGWKQIEQVREKVEISQENASRPGFRSRRKQEPIEEYKPIKVIDLLNGHAFGTSIKGDINVPDDTPEHRRVLTYHEKLSDNFTFFQVVPKELPKISKSVSFSEDVKNNENEACENKENSSGNKENSSENKENSRENSNGVIENGVNRNSEENPAEQECKPTPLGYTSTFSVYLKKLDSEEMNVRSESCRTFQFDLNDADVREYYRPPTPVITEKPKAAKPAVSEDTSILSQVKKEATTPQAPRKNFNTPSYTRLTKPNRPPKIASSVMTSSVMTSNRPVKKVAKESKVLSGRSLQILAKEIQQGLTLAVHLNLPDSCVTGIGFDSLSNGLNLVDVTYKILLYWKRTYKGKKETQVDDLVQAIKEMNRIDVASILMDRHRNNIELSQGCFDI